MIAKIEVDSTDEVRLRETKEAAESVVREQYGFLGLYRKMHF